MRHRFHSMCPYFAMFPESFAERWIKRLTRPGDTVLDPFSGRGTTALTALLNGRNAVACDVNDVAFCLTRAKTSAPTVRSLLRRIDQLESEFRFSARTQPASDHTDFFQSCFSARTLAQLSYLRASLQWRKRRTDTMVGALLLGILHGETSPSSKYLSNQMPRTISTKPAYSLRFWRRHNLKPPDKDVFATLKDVALYRYESPRPVGSAHIIHGDMRKLPFDLSLRKTRPVCAITSPPYLNVTNFEEDQWLRLWLLGGPPAPTRGRLSRDDRHLRPDAYWQFIADMWRSLGAVVAENGHVVVRIGSRSMETDAVKRALTASSRFSGRKISLVSSRVTEIKKRQTDAFRPGTLGCRIEVDCHFAFQD
jgi:hypothetical protein